MSKIETVNSFKEWFLRVVILWLTEWSTQERSSVTFLWKEKGKEGDAFTAFEIRMSKQF